MLTALERTKNECLRTKRVELESHNPESRGSGEHIGEEKVIDLKSDRETHSLRGDLELISTEVTGDSTKITIKLQSVLSSLLTQTLQHGKLKGKEL